MPLMVIGTWYGMNLEGIYELKWKHGYKCNYVALYRLTVWWFKDNKWL
jgi:Mg2+ and Co2+ transporter CorA